MIDQASHETYDMSIKRKIGMKWRKLGLVFGKTDFASFSSHAQLPTPILLEDRIRVFYAARNAGNKSFTTFVDLDLDDPLKIIYNHKAPVMNSGLPGTFDDDGVMPGLVLRKNKQLWMYYSGWNQRVTTPYHNSTGLAVSSDDGRTFQRMFEGPVMDRTPVEPYLAVTPTILQEKDHMKMWYISGLKWVLVEEKYEPVYVIKEAQSADGISWIRSGRQVIPSHHDMEAFSHPTAFKLDGVYHMYFCFRGSHDYRNGSQAYRIGYARSEDGTHWKRLDDEFEMIGTRDDWESKMNCYPFFIEIKKNKYLFYNGNGFGQSGFGIAKLEE